MTVSKWCIRKKGVKLARNEKKGGEEYAVLENK